MPLDLIKPEWGLVVPQLIVFFLAIILMLGDAFIPRERHYILLTAISIIGYVAAGIALIWQYGENKATFYGLFRADDLGVFLGMTILVAALLTVFVSASYVEYLEGRMPLGEFYVLLALSTLGALIVAIAGDLILLFIGIELSSLATYVLTAYAKRRETSLEGALKYYLLGIFASAIMVYGFAWIYGATGTTDLTEIARVLQASVSGDHREASLLLGLLLIIVGVGFKMAAVPFHFWTPDAYDGAPTPVTGFMSSVPKTAAFALAIRLLVQGLAPLRDDWLILIAILAFITMTFANIVAVAQRDVKRMLAYSSVAHTGYMLAGLAAYKSVSGFGGTGSGDFGISSVLFYLLAYAFTNIGAFAVVAWVQHRGNGLDLDDYAGLAAKEPLAAAALSVFLLSLMGMPPLLGFYAKYYVIVALLDAKLLWLAIAIVVLSAISAFYYLRVVAVMYFSEAKVEHKKVSTPLLNIGIAGMVIAVIVVGFFSSGILNLADHWTQALSVAQAVTP
jgi:NADH-quinone oxidoreductase subunit N